MVWPYIWWRQACNRSVFCEKRERKTCKRRNIQPACGVQAADSRLLVPFSKPFCPRAAAVVDENSLREFTVFPRKAAINMRFHVCVLCILVCKMKKDMLCLCIYIYMYRKAKPMNVILYLVMHGFDYLFKSNSKRYL